MSRYFPHDDVEIEIQPTPPRFKSPSAMLELNLPSLAESKERKQKRRLMVLLAGLNTANYSDDRGIRELKWEAQKFVRNGTCDSGRDAEISEFCKEIQNKCKQASRDRGLWIGLSDASKNFYLAGKGIGGKDPIEELIQHLEDQKKQTQKQWKEEQKRMQKRRLVVLMARVCEADYSNDSNISSFKAYAQTLVDCRSSYTDKNGEYTPEFDTRISGLCRDLCQKIKQRGALPDCVFNEALKAFYKAGQSEDLENAIEGLIKCLETQEKKAQEQHLIRLLANLKMEDYVDNPQIRNFKERAQAFIDKEDRLIPGTENDVRVLLRDIHSESKANSKSKYGSPAITAFYFAGRQQNFIGALIADLEEQHKSASAIPGSLDEKDLEQTGQCAGALLAQSQIEEEIRYDNSGSNRLNELAQNWLRPSPLQEKDPDQTRQYADVLLVQPEMSALKEEVKAIRAETETAYRSAIIDDETRDKILHYTNVEAIESMLNMERPVDQVRQGPACNWDFLKVDTENISPNKEVASRILMGIGIVVGVGLLVGLGLATGGVVPAVFAAVTAVVATVAPPITLPLAIGSVAGIAGSLGVCLHKSRDADIASSKEGKTNYLVDKGQNLFRFQFQPEHRRVDKVKKEESQQRRGGHSSPMKIDLSRS